MIYIVLGMHKSGTTLLSQILHHSGISMGENFNESVSYSQGNKYERETTQQINKEILGDPTAYSIDIPLPKTLKLTSPPSA